MDISIIIPVYNEEDNIRLIYSALKRVLLRSPKQYELIFIDDGSSDQSLAVLKSILPTDSCVKIICFDRNYGQTAAWDAGFRQAGGEVVLTIDADCQYDPQDLLRILEELKKDDVDAVLGKRVNRTSGWIKSICSKLAVLIRNSVLGESYQDASLGGYKRKCIEDLMLYKDTQVFMPALLKIQGRRIEEIAVQEYPRQHGRSKYNLRNRLFNRLCTLLMIKWLKDNQLNYKISHVIKQP
jgi:dolichol-phosphate mannosyltransferase